MQFSLGIHIQLFQLIEDLLQIHAVFGQNEDRFIDCRQTDFRLSFSLNINVNGIAGCSLIQVSSQSRPAGDSRAETLKGR